MGKQQQGGMTLGSPAAGGLSHINGLNGLAGGFGPGVLSPAGRLFAEESTPIIALHQFY